MGFSFQDVDWILGLLFLTGTLVTPRDYHYSDMKFVCYFVFMCLRGVNYSCPCIRTQVFSFGTFMNVLTFFVTFIRMLGRGRGRRGRRGRQEMPLPDDIPAQQEGVGQANVAEPAGQEATGALGRVIAETLRESVGIFRAKNPVQTPVQAQAVEAGHSFLKREFFGSNPDEFVGDPKEPLKADEWL